MSTAANPRQFVIRLIFLGVAIVILIRLLFLQIFEDKYKIMANEIAIYRKIVYPPRGVIQDRKGKVMLYNKVAYDLMVSPYQVKKDLDTDQLCAAIDMDKPTFKKQLERIKIRNGSMRQAVFVEQLSPAQTAHLQENMYLFPGFELVERSIRTYPDPSAGILLGI